MTTTPATFPNDLLAYLEVAVTRPLRPGAIAHRAVYYWVTQPESGHHRHETLTGAACQPTTTRTTPFLDNDGNPVQETVPATPCASMSAAWAQAHGATRCTDPACYPLPAATPATAGKRATKRTSKRATARKAGGAS